MNARYSNWRLLGCGAPGAGAGALERLGAATSAVESASTVNAAPLEKWTTRRCDSPALTCDTCWPCKVRARRSALRSRAAKLPRVMRLRCSEDSALWSPGGCRNLRGGAQPGAVPKSCSKPGAAALSEVESLPTRNEPGGSFSMSKAGLTGSLRTEMLDHRRDGDRQKPSCRIDSSERDGCTCIAARLRARSVCKTSH